jgi:hypothetical protein
VLDSAGISTVDLRVSWNDGGTQRVLLLSAWTAPPPPGSHVP